MSIEASLALVAGSDTTATTLSNAVFYLIRHPQVFARLRVEIDAACGGHGNYEEGIEPSILSELEYLQAVLNETLRLQPAVPNGIQRTSPEHDVVIPGTKQ
jgi:cytochrome P450